MIAENRKTAAARYGMTIDVDRCNGCGACMVACAVENNVPPAAAGATDRTGLTWIRVFRVDNGAECPGPALRVRSGDVPALRQGSALRQRLPAAGRGGGPGDRHRGPDARALPRLPLLHGRLPVPRALLQLVGSGMAGRHGKDAQSRRISAHARRGGEVQLLPRPLACRQSQGRSRREDGKSTPPTTSRPASKPVRPRAIQFGDLNDASSRAAQARAAAPNVSGCSNRSAPSRRSTTSPRRSGCGRSPARRRPRQGERAWLRNG